MNSTLMTAIISITLALVLYTVGVWGEKLQKLLKPGHVILFWAGFIFDTIGTTCMSLINTDGAVNQFHAVTGIVAILLMFFHAVWATIVLIKKDERKILHFHKFSFVVWIIWLIPFVSGMIMGMST